MARQVIDNGASLDDPTATDTVRSAFGKVNTMTSDLYAYGHNVLAYGAVGDSSHSSGGGTDDTTAIQAAIDAAVVDGTGYGVVFIPANRTYRITSTITVPGGITIAGIGGRNGAGNFVPATIVWDGNNSTGMFTHTANTANVPMTRFENLLIAGGGGISNKPTWGIRFTTTGGALGLLDSGTSLRNVWFQTINGNGLDVRQGITNLDIDGGRFDDIFGGYGIYVEGSGSMTIKGGTNWVGGSTGQGNGFMFLDGEAASDGEFFMLDIQGLHTEVNTSLSETFAGGTNPYDRRGVIRLGVASARPHPQHFINVNTWFQGTAGGVSSFSAFQITASGGTDAQNSDMVSLNINNATGIHSVVVDDSGTTNEIRILGGRFDEATRQYLHPFGRVHGFRYGYGKDSTAESMRRYSVFRDGTDAFYGLSLNPRTVASLPAFVYGPNNGAGALAYVSDANSTTRHATVAGGGSNKLLVQYNGTNWIIV